MRWFAADVSTFYQVMAEQVVAKLGLKPTAVHLDITSFHVDGAYDCADGEQTGRLQLVRGYSRDHRPELNQVILSRSVRPGRLPVYPQAPVAMATITAPSFETVIATAQPQVRAGAAIRSVTAPPYRAETLHLLHHQRQLFITRVPRTRRKHECWQPLVSAADRAGRWPPGRWLDADYADVLQRWLLVRSERPTMPSRKRCQAPAGRQHPRAQGVHQTVRAALCSSGRCRSGAGALCQRAETTGDCARPRADGARLRQRRQTQKRPATRQLSVPHREGQPRPAWNGGGNAQTGVFILATNDLSGTLTMAGTAGHLQGTANG